MKEPRDAYKVLQVDPEADLEVIQAAYRRLAQKYHPDRAATSADSDTAALRMVELNTAYDAVRDAYRRAEYDRRRAALARAAAATGPGVPPLSATSAPTASAAAEPTGSAGPPPGRPSGSVLNFGRYAGWSLGEISRVDPSYVQWLDRVPIGRPYRDEVDALLRRLGQRLSADDEASERRGLFRRR